LGLVRRLIPLALAAALLAGCGGSKAKPKAAPSPASVLAGGRTLYRGGDWAVVARGATAVAAHLVDGAWKADRSGTVKISVLSPPSRSNTMPQVAVSLKSPTPLIETGLWVDGRELIEKGGGKPTDATIYSAPDRRLRPGRHVVVAYGRTATAGTAVAWVFRAV
jgi:hypothetical protein